MQHPTQANNTANPLPWRDRLVLCADGVYRTNQEITEYIQSNNADYMDADYEYYLRKRMKSSEERA